MQVTPAHLLSKIKSVLGNEVMNITKLAIVILVKHKLGQKSEWTPFVFIPMFKILLKYEFQVHAQNGWVNNRDANIGEVKVKMLVNLEFPFVWSHVPCQFGNTKIGMVKCLQGAYNGDSG